MARTFARYEPIEMSAATPEGVQQLTFYSESLRGRGDVSLFVPQECAAAKEQRVPLVVLLHGVYGSHWSWFLSGAAHRTAQRLMDEGRIRPMVLACPSDGLRGDGSGYLPYAEANYESWIGDDVVGGVQQVTGCTASGPVFLAGLSMGGYGALRLGMKYPEKFAALSAHSSITKIEEFGEFVRHPMREETLPAGETELLHWARAHKQKLPPMRFDCGKDDALYSSNVALDAALTELGIAHTFETFPGAHEWAYWEKHLVETLLFFETNCGS